MSELKQNLNDASNKSTDILPNRLLTTSSQYEKCYKRINKKTNSKKYSTNCRDLSYADISKLEYLGFDVEEHTKKINTHTVLWNTY